MPTATANAIYAVSGGPLVKVYNSRNLRIKGMIHSHSPRVRGWNDSPFKGVDCDIVRSTLRLGEKVLLTVYGYMSTAML